MNPGARSLLFRAANVIKGHSEYRGLLFVLGVFTVSRVLYALAGVRFYSWAETHLMHFVSQDLLRTDLFRSVFYLHNQPPLFNLFMGIVLKIVPGTAEPVFHAVFIVLGLALAVSLYLLMRRLGSSVRMSAALTSLFIASPACILFENALLYTYFVTVFLVLAALFLHRWIENGRTFDGAAFFILLALVVLTRSFFHPAWYAVCAAVALLFRRIGWRRAVLLAGIPLLVVCGLYVKNLVLFGSFSSSTWMGMSLAKMTTFNLPEEERVAMVRRGELSELSLLPPFKGLWFYARYVHVPRFEKTGIPVLDLDFYPEVGNNWNNLSFVSIDRQYQKDALVVMHTHPTVYVRSLTEALSIFFFPASYWFHLNPKFSNILGIDTVERLYNTLVYGQLLNPFGAVKMTANYADYLTTPSAMGFFILGAWLAALFMGVRAIVRLFRGSETDIPRAATLVFMAFTILFVTVVTNMLEVGENNRFRFNVEPYLFAAVGMAVSALYTRLRNRRQSGALSEKSRTGKHIRTGRK
jgi:hypothetical protein